MRNKILFDFLVKPYLNIKTMATLANVSTAFREWSVVDNNKWWFKYYYVLNIEGKNYHAKKRNIQMWEIDQKFEKYSKKYQATFVPTMSYYHRLVFCGVFAIKDNMFNITKDMMTDQRNMIKVTLTQKDQLTLLFPEKPSHILTAIANCDVLVEKAEKEVERLKRVLVFMQLCVDIRLNIRLFEKTYLGSISPL